MMEVDMQSPPSAFRPVGFTIKRPRSPGSPTQERQTKRLSLVPVGASTEGQCVRRASTIPDGSLEGRMTSQDDWVRQARELSIASPLSITVGFPSLEGSTTPSRVDEHHMAVDYEEQQMFRVHVHPGTTHARPWATTRSHLPLIHISTTPAPAQDALHVPSPAPFSVLTESPSSSTESASSSSSISVTETSVSTRTQPCPPDIFLFPATPSDTSSHQHQFATAYGHQNGEGEPGPQAQMQQDQRLSQSSLTRTEDRVDGSSRPSRVLEVPTASGRKHRVTMGPRADCVKCRTGVRGHWMHFD